MSQSLEVVPEKRVIPEIFTNPSIFKNMMDFATLLSKSDLVPKDFKGNPGNILVAIQMGAEVGLAPMQAIQNIAVINGRPCVWGDAMLAIVQGSGKLEQIKEWNEVDAKGQGISFCRTKRRDYPEPYTNSFSDEDAKVANLLGKSGPWQTNRSRMRQMRARAFNLRDQFADVLRGLNSAEEVQDHNPSTEPSSVQVSSTSKSSGLVSIPKRKSEVLAEAVEKKEEEKGQIWFRENNGKSYIGTQLGKPFSKEFLESHGFKPSKISPETYFRESSEEVYDLLKIEIETQNQREPGGEG